jgi:hypothetical protein
MKKTRQNKKLKPGSDSIRTGQALISALIVKLTMQRGRANSFPSPNLACLVTKLWQHGLLFIFAGNGARCGTRINAASRILPLAAIFFIVATTAASTQRSCRG